MTIERRYNHRIRHPFEVQIVFRNRRFHVVASGHSSDGMFLMADFLTIPPGNMVDIEFPFNGENRLIPALVIHSNGRGLGVMFRRPQPELVQAISRIPAIPCTPPATDTVLCANRQH